MNIVLDIILPVFGALLIGYGAARAGWFDETANRGLSLFVFNFALPLLLFRSVATTTLPGTMPWGYLLGYYLAAFAVYGGAMLAARWLFGRRSVAEQGVLGLGAGFSNTALLGIPLVLTAFGDEAALPLFVLIASHSLLLLPPTTMLAELAGGGRGHLGHTLRGLLSSVFASPIVLALLTGLALNLLGLRLPSTVDAVARSLGASASPCALFALGASLTRYRVTGALAEPLLLVGLKLVLQPLLAWLLLHHVFAVPPLWTVVAVTLAALPAGVTPYLYGQRYGICLATLATATLIGTLLSVASLSTLVWAFKAP